VSDIDVKSTEPIDGERAVKRVIEMQSKIDQIKRERDALRKDRDQLLNEFTDLRNSRPVPTSPPKRSIHGKETVRVACGDVHGMRMDKHAVSAFMQDIKTLNPDEIVLGGDILECGGWLAKHQPIGYVAYCDYTYQEDVKAANLFLDQLQINAPNAVIHYIEGNHEIRVERWIVDQTLAHMRESDFLLKAFGPAALLRLEERGVTYYKRDQIYVKGAPRGWIKLGKMYFTHSLTYSVNAARQAASKTAGNVTYFCTHRRDTATIVFPSVGLVEAYNPGCLSQMQPIWKHSDPTSWSQGYAIEIIAKSGNYQHINVPIWRGESLAGTMVKRFKA
jgi:hypothetical protein